MAETKNIALSGAEVEVAVGGRNANIRNDGTDTIYVSCYPDITAGADGVLSIPAGGAVVLHDAKGTVYVKGSGAAAVVGTDSDCPVFKSAAAGGGEGSGADPIAREAINTHAKNTDIHHTTAEIEEIAASAGGGAKFVMTTQAEFDAAVAAGTDDHDTYYVITDAGGDDGILAALLAEESPDTFFAEVK